MKYPKLTLSYLTVAIGATLASPLSMANESQANGKDGGLEHIEVTARKSLESLQKIPVSITSIGAEQLSQQGMAVITEVQQLSPNTTLQNSRGTSSTLTAFIRGVGQEDPLWGYEPGVGIYIDDVYVARPQGAVLDILNIERIEVLRGPQGSLYGRNTIGGAIKYVTRKMSGDTEFTFTGTLGNYNRRDLTISGQVPLIEDKLYLGFAGSKLKRAGYGDFVTSALADQHTENYNKNVFAGRLTLEYSPNDDLFMRLQYDKTDDDSNAKGGYRLLPSLLTNAPVPDSVYDSYTSLPTKNRVTTEGVSFTLDYQMDNYWAFKSITAHRDSYSPTNIDFDNTSLPIFDVPAIYDDKQFTQEFQLNYDDEQLNFVSGLYYFEGDSCGTFDAILEVYGQSLGFPGLTREVSGCSNSTSYALYGQGSYQFTDKFSVTLGARYTHEEKDAEVYNGLIYQTVYPESNWIPGYERPADISIPKILDNSKQWSRFSPRLGLEYQYNDDMLLFASYSQGFKSGTFNPRASMDEPAVNPEIVDSFELGIKSEWHNNLRANATLFYLDHQDRQFVGQQQGSNASEIQQRLGNIGRSTSTGAELEVQYAASEQLNVFFSLGIINSSFKEVNTLDNNGLPIDISDTYTIANTPDTTANLGFDYSIYSNYGDFIINGNYYYRSDYDLTIVDNLLSQDGYGLLNLSLNWYSNDGHWQSGLHWKNITDQEYLVGTYTFVTPTADGGYLPGLGGDNTLIGYYGDPETISLTVSYNF